MFNYTFWVLSQLQRLWPKAGNFGSQGLTRVQQCVYGPKLYLYNSIHDSSKNQLEVLAV